MIKHPRTDCTFPPEYCEFGPCFDKCKDWLAENHPEYLDGAVPTSKAPATAAAAAGGKAAGKAKKKKKHAEVLIRLTARTKRKRITSVTGLDAYGIKLKKAAKLLSKKFACSASSVRGTNGPEIQLQGDVSYDVGEYIVSEWPEIPAKCVLVVSKTGKKSAAIWGADDDDDNDEEDDDEYEDIEDEEGEEEIFNDL